MTKTLKERVNQRMEAMGLKNIDLARACKVKAPTSFNWASGKTKNIKGEPLLLAAAALGVTPNWLANGTEPKFPEHAKNTTDQHLASAQIGHYQVAQTTPTEPARQQIEPFDLFSVEDWMQLSAEQRHQFEGPILFAIKEAKKRSQAA